MTEFDLIRRYFDRGAARNAELGIGDDAAVLDLRGQQLVTCTDMLVQDRHFFAGTDPAAIGYKSLAVNLSDLAAMGARPVAFVLALALPEIDEHWLAGFSAGLFQAADQANCELIGGDTTRGPLTICITAYGTVPNDSAIRRDRAEPGHDVWVSGCLGGAAAAVQCRQDTPNWSACTPEFSDQIARRLDWPQARVGLGQELRHVASAAIDVSDGLLSDLAHIAERSRAAIVVDADQVPVASALTAHPRHPQALFLALNGGDDYEIAFTAAPENRLAIDGVAKRTGLLLTRIGAVQAGQGIRVIDAQGKPLDNIPGGYDHFA